MKRTEFVNDVILTAVDDGGIDYWCEVDRFTRSEDGITGFSGHDPEDDEPRVLDTAKVEAGIQAIVSGTCKVRQDIREAVILAHTLNDPGYIDAEIADCILQAGLFGEITFG
jgi:hypothetical protein